MTYAAHHKDFVPYIEDLALSGNIAVRKKAGVLRRIVDAIYKSPQRQTDREIGCLIERSGGCLTDDLERQMVRRLSTWDWDAPY
jgi:hypothetical protein